VVKGGGEEKGEGKKEVKEKVRIKKDEEKKGPFEEKRSYTVHGTFCLYDQHLGWCKKRFPGWCGGEKREG